MRIIARRGVRIGDARVYVRVRSEDSCYENLRRMIRGARGEGKDTSGTRRKNLGVFRRLCIKATLRPSPATTVFDRIYEPRMPSALLSSLASDVRRSPSRFMYRAIAPEERGANSRRLAEGIRPNVALGR